MKKDLPIFNYDFHGPLCALMFIQGGLLFGDSFDDELAMSVKELNKGCPIMMTNEIRLDNYTALPGRNFALVP